MRHSDIDHAIRGSGFPACLACDDEDYERDCPAVPNARLVPVEQTSAHIHDRFKLEWLDAQRRLRVSYFSTDDAVQRHLIRHGLVVVRS